MLALTVSAAASAVDLFLVGDATPVGWNIGGASRTTQLTEVSPGVFEWIGKLVPGTEGFKVSENVSDWGAWHPAVGGTLIDGTSDTMVNGDDTKWKVSAEDIYKVTIVWDTKQISCEKYSVDLAPNADGVYEIGDAATLYKFATYVSHAVIPQTSTAVLTADIDYTAAEYAHGVIGHSQIYPFKGTFDGRGHKITVNLTEWGDRTGLFAYTNAATIRNLEVDGTVNMTNRNCAGGLGGRCDGSGTLIENIVSKVSINDAQSGDGTYGGLFANIEGVATVRNCAFYGSINAPSRDGNGGLVGWTGGMAGVQFVNCIVAPSSISWAGGATIARNTPTVTNCYSTAAIPANTFTYQGGATVTEVTADDLQSPEFVYKSLNSNSSSPWFLTIGTDLVPSPLTSHLPVYANGELNCDGTPKGTVSYSNTEGSTIDPHTFANGICSVCDADEAPALVDGVYQIANAGNLRAFATLVNTGNGGISGTILSDINLTGVAYTPIGKDATKFWGTLDGQLHRIKGMAITGSGINERGLIAVASGGATVRNIIIDGSCNINGEGKLSGLIGCVNNTNHGDWVYIINCGNEADITGTNANCSGLIGVNYDGGLKIHIENCYNTGNIAGTVENAAFSGWLGNSSSVVINSWNSGNVTGVEGSNTLARNIVASNFINSFDLGNDGAGKVANTVMEGYDASWLASGRAAHTMNSGAASNVWYQTLASDSHPVLETSHDVVVKITAAKYATLAAPCNIAVSAQSNVQAFGAQVMGSGVHLEPAAAVRKGEAVVLYADVADDSYFGLPTTTDDVAALAGNELKSSATAVTADGTHYGLARPADAQGSLLPAGFYKVISGTDIPAGRCFLTVASGGAKGGYPFIDGPDSDSATGIDAAEVNAADGDTYNIQGQRITAPVKGINIINGKKVLVK